MSGYVQQLVAQENLNGEIQGKESQGGCPYAESSIIDPSDLLCTRHRRLVENDEESG